MAVLAARLSACHSDSHLCSTEVESSYEQSLDPQEESSVWGQDSQFCSSLLSIGTFIGVLDVWACYKGCLCCHS